ncbi:Hypothetical protein AA314_05654 [Archangium gephyra]|uniref:Uncharacterized protein n=1 Tax=Archangium gephyra TaxID=48 RepID=A0AAC8QB54_9BACT|nr:Hypothetical protein AA314_05654 [Archangium gephyra]
MVLREGRGRPHHGVEQAPGAHPLQHRGQHGPAVGTQLGGNLRNPSWGRGTHPTTPS